MVGADTANHTVAIVVYDGVAMFEFAIAYEVFGDDHNLGADWYTVLICGEAVQPKACSSPGRRPLGERLTARFDNGMPLEVTHGLAQLRRADTVIVPPCEAPGGAPEEVLRALRRAHARGARIASLCTGTFVLAAAGLLDGQRVTTHWAESQELAERYPKIAVDPDVLYVDGGSILTSAGSAASIDLCLHLVRQDHGAEVATRVARDLVVPPYRDGGQAQYIDTPLPAVSATDLFADALGWAREHLGEPMTIATLAARSAMSRRTFARRFLATTGTTPYRWLLSQRLRLAQRLLETTDLTVEAVAVAAGFLDAGNLRRHFTRSLRTTPAAYRTTFRSR